jgi:chemotaxis protein methyltransferase CheR
LRKTGRGQTTLENYKLTATEFALFRDLIYKVAGISLSDSKRHLVQSRLQKRLRHHNLTQYRQYYDMVASRDSDHPEMIEMVNCITTNKTDFFRERHHFAFVTDTILPEIERRGGPKRLRIWHAGCSTGEEPYTLAIALAEALGPHYDWDVRQLASDIDTQVLAYAERGVYDFDRVDTIPGPLLRKYFLCGRGDKADFVKVKPELKRRIQFRRINLLEENWRIPSEARFDILFCRNVVIYFDEPTRQRLFARFAAVLRPGGYMFIGHSESLVGVSNAFESMGQTIYRLPDLHADAIGTNRHAA